MSDAAPLRVAYVLRHYPQLSQTFVRNEIAALREAGHVVDVFSMHRADASHVTAGWSGPYEVLADRGVLRGVSAALWWLAHHPVRTVQALSGLVRLHRRDLVRPFLTTHLPLARQLSGTGLVACHTHFAWDAVAPTSLLARLLGVPSSVTVHAKDVYQVTPDTRRRLDAVDRVVTVCRYNVDHLSRSGLVDRPVAVVPCGVAAPAEVAPLGGRSVVSVGRLVEKKGFAGLLTAFGDVQASVPGATLTIIGDGPLHRPLRELVASLDLRDSVTFTGPLDAAATLEAIATCSVFVLNCTPLPDGDSDALPVVLREAMVRGRPTVSTAVAGIPELLADDCGWLVPPSDRAALAAALTQALTDPEEARIRAAAARHQVLECGTLELTAALMSDVLGLRGRRLGATSASSPGEPSSRTAGEPSSSSPRVGCWSAEPRP